MVGKEDGQRLAGGALQFLRRAQMSGDDADAYIAVRNWLTMVATGALDVVPPAPVNLVTPAPTPQLPMQATNDDETVVGPSA